LFCSNSTAWRIQEKRNAYFGVISHIEKTTDKLIKMKDYKETNLEYTLTNMYKDDLISYIASHQDDFPELIKLSISDKKPYSWRAAWLLWSCMNNNDKRIRRHIKMIIDILPNRQDSQQRELLMVLQRMELDSKYEGQLFDSCTKIWENINKNSVERRLA